MGQGHIQATASVRRWNRRVPKVVLQRHDRAAYRTVRGALPDSKPSKKASVRCQRALNGPDAVPQAQRGSATPVMAPVVQSTVITLSRAK